MTASRDELASLSADWAAHPLAPLEGRLALGETIRAETLARLGQTPLPVDPTTLPVISLDLDGAGHPASGEGGGAPDLRVLSVLGEGGMGRVLLARQRSLHRDVAVKTLRGGAAASPRAVDALLREGAMMGSLEHPCIVPVHALGRDRAGAPLLVMKRIDGVALDALLADPAHPMWARWTETTQDRRAGALLILMEVCDAIEFAHRQGVVHRDIKPANVLLGAGGEVYVSDWGVATRLADDEPAQILGTPMYMAPEMVAGDRARLSPRTDVYLLGATLHEVLTGTPRHQRATLQMTLFAALLSEPVTYDDDVPSDLAALCNEATHEDPARRPPSARAFRARLAEHLRHRGSLALAREGRTKLEALRPLLAEAAPDLAALHRAATECRYAYEQSLREWPGNPEARRGREECLRALLAHEFARENADAAEALTRDLGDAPDDVAAVGALRARLTARRAEAARAQREARERDVSIGARQRGVLVAALSLVAAVVFTALAPRAAPALPRVTPFFVGAPAAALVAVAGVTLALRRALLATRINRDLIGMLLTGLGWITLHRAVLLATGVDRDVPRIISEDLFMLAAISAVGAIAVRVELTQSALAFAVAYGVSKAAPRWDLYAFTLSTLLGPVLTYLALSRSDARRADRDG